MRNEENKRNYSEEGKDKMDSLKEKLKDKKVRIAIAALIIMVGASIVLHFCG